MAEIRTRFVLGKVYSYILKDDTYDVPAVNEEEDRVSVFLRLSVDRVVPEIKPHVDKITREVEVKDLVDEKNLERIVQSIGKKYVPPSFVWKHIVSFFTAVGRFGVWCRSNGVLDKFLTAIYEYVEKELEHLIQERRTWEKLVEDRHSIEKVRRKLF